MAIRFVIDSGSDILPVEAEKKGMVHVPLTVSFEGQEYLDAVELGHEEFYDKLESCENLSVTSQVPPYRFEEAFEKVVSEGDTVIAITISGALSGTHQSACIAAAEFPGKVYVVDSENVSLGMRILVERSLELLEQGLNAEEIVEKLNEEKKRVRVLALLDTLEYLKKGGRISSATAFAGGLLNIKPVVTVKDGLVEMVGKARGSKAGNNLLRKLIQEGNGVDFKRPYFAAYSGKSDALLQKYLKDSADLWQTEVQEMPIGTVGSVIGTHVGPNVVAVAFFEKE
ncbi:MAG: DegV family protein [Lachnospiraceae bacterium]